jgi:L-gulonate 5-dehydrogenase
MPNRRKIDQMVSIIVREPGSLEVRSANVPEPKADEVVVKVRRAGICGSDVHILHGSNPFAVYPRVIGHEFAGEVFSLGSEVSAIRLGDHVVIDPVLSCGNCYPCRIGRSNVCANLQVMGVHRDGGFRDYVAVPASAIISVPSDMPFSLAALAEPFSIAANVLSRTGCGRDDTVLIYGAGTVGVTVLQVAKLHGARCIVAEIEQTRLGITAQSSSYSASGDVASRGTP